MTFLTCAPNYPDGRVFPGYTNRLYRVEWLDGVRVVRTWSYITPCQDFGRRILNYGTFSASVFFDAFSGQVKPQAMMSYSPPLPLGISAWLLSKLWGVPWVLRVEDLFPDAAVAVGVLKNRTAIYILARLEHFLYRKAKSISLISDGFYRSLAEKGVPTQKISVAPVWADPNRCAHNLRIIISVRCMACKGNSWCYMQATLGTPPPWRMCSPPQLSCAMTSRSIFFLSAKG